MKEVEKWKSLSSFLEDIFHKFEYEDFQPPVETLRLYNKFKEFFFIDSPFWAPWSSAIDSNFWFAIGLKSYFNYSQTVVAFNLRKSNLIVQVKEEPEFRNLIHFEDHFQYSDIWLNHKKLNNLSLIVIESILFANRDNSQTPFPVLKLRESLKS